MAITNLCGFETGTGGADNEGTLTGAGATIQSTTKRTGTYALKINPTTTATADFNIFTGFLTTGVFATNGAATAYYRFYFYVVTLPSAEEPIFSAYNNAAALKAELRINSSGNLVYLDSTLTVKGTSGTALSTGSWYRIELRVGTSTTIGNYQLLIDGNTEIALGSDANLTASNNYSVFLGKHVDRNGSGYEAYYDDFAINPTGFSGAGAIACLRPRANGNYTAWAGVYTDIDDLVAGAGNDGDTTKWTSSTITQAETCALDSCATAGISGTINAVKSIIVAKRTSASLTAIQYRVRVTSPGTLDTDGTDYTTLATFAALSVVQTVNPSGSAAWTTAGVDSLEVGIDHNQSQARQADCTMVCAMVDFTAAAGPAADIPPLPTIVQNAVAHAAFW